MANDAKSVFGKNIQILIMQRNWSIKHAAAELGYDRQDLSAITMGNKNFKLETAVRLARYFNVSLFLLFSRHFDNRKNRAKFLFVEADYMEVLRTNFRAKAISQASIPLDSTTTSHILNGRRNNITIDTLSKFSYGESAILSELLKTNQDRLIELQLQEETE